MYSSFKVTTNKANWDCSYENTVVGSEKWIVKLVYKGNEVTASFALPKDWGRTRVFQFIDSLDEGMI